jgi:hypothetical protein
MFASMVARPPVPSLEESTPRPAPEGTRSAVAPAGRRLIGAGDRLLDRGPDGGAPAPVAARSTLGAGRAAAGARIAFATINAKTTPAGMASRIPPRIDYDVAVTLAGPGPAEIFVDGASAANGRATVNGGSTAMLRASGWIRLRGIDQTAPGSAGRLRVVAKVGSTRIGASNRFTICAIPTRIRIVQGGTVRYSRRGVVATTYNDSDSGRIGDLDKVEISEKVHYFPGTGCFEDVISGDNSYYLAANLWPHAYDEHSTPVAIMDIPGTFVADQLFVFRDGRSGVSDVAVARSGFRIRRAVTWERTPHWSGLIVRTTKAPLATTVRGTSARPGEGSVASPGQSL